MAQRLSSDRTRDRLRDRQRQRTQRICAIVDSVPAGRVATYGQVAREAGLPRGARQVGYVLAHLPRGTTLAWHRIVNAQGMASPRGDGGSVRLQCRLLTAEGVRFARNGRIDLKEFQWEPDWTEGARPGAEGKGR